MDPPKDVAAETAAEAAPQTLGQLMAMGEKEEKPRFDLGAMGLHLARNVTAPLGKTLHQGNHAIIAMRNVVVPRFRKVQCLKQLVEEADIRHKKLEEEKKKKKSKKDNDDDDADDAEESTPTPPIWGPISPRQLYLNRIKREEYSPGPSAAFPLQAKIINRTQLKKVDAEKKVGDQRHTVVSLERQEVLALEKIQLPRLHLWEQRLSHLENEKKRLDSLTPAQLSGEALVPDETLIEKGSYGKKEMFVKTNVLIDSSSIGMAASEAKGIYAYVAPLRYMMSHLPEAIKKMKAKIDEGRNKHNTARNGLRTLAGKKILWYLGHRNEIRLARAIADARRVYFERVRDSEERYWIRWEKRRLERARRRREAAILIQQAWRAFWDRLQAWKRSFTPAALTIQCGWRQHLARSRVREVKIWWSIRHQAASRIQTWFRPKLDDAAYERHEEILIEIAKQEVVRQKVLKKYSVKSIQRAVRRWLTWKHALIKRRLRGLHPNLRVLFDDFRDATGRGSEEEGEGEGKGLQTNSTSSLPPRYTRRTRSTHSRFRAVHDFVNALGDWCERHKSLLARRVDTEGLSGQLVRLPLRVRLSKTFERRQLDRTPRWTQRSPRSPTAAQHNLHRTAHDMAVESSAMALLLEEAEAENKLEAAAAAAAAAGAEGGEGGAEEKKENDNAHNRSLSRQLSADVDALSAAYSEQAVLSPTSTHATINTTGSFKSGSRTTLPSGISIRQSDVDQVASINTSRAASGGIGGSKVGDRWVSLDEVMSRGISREELVYDHLAGSLIHHTDGGISIRDPPTLDHLPIWYLPLRFWTLLFLLDEDMWFVQIKTWHRDLTLRNEQTSIVKTFLTIAAGLREEGEDARAIVKSCKRRGGGSKRPFGGAMGRRVSGGGGGGGGRGVDNGGIEGDAPLLRWFELQELCAVCLGLPDADANAARCDLCGAVRATSQLTVAAAIRRSANVGARERKRVERIRYEETGVIGMGQQIHPPGLSSTSSQTTNANAGANSNVNSQHLHLQTRPQPHPRQRADVRSSPHMYLRLFLTHACFAARVFAVLLQWPCRPQDWRRFVDVRETWNASVLHAHDLSVLLQQRCNVFDLPALQRVALHDPSLGIEAGVVLQLQAQMEDLAAAVDLLPTGVGVQLHHQGTDLNSIKQLGVEGDLMMNNNNEMWGTFQSLPAALRLEPPPAVEMKASSREPYHYYEEDDILHTSHSTGVLRGNTQQLGRRRAVLEKQQQQQQQQRRRQRRRKQRTSSSQKHMRPTWEKLVPRRRRRRPASQGSPSQQQGVSLPYIS